MLDRFRKHVANHFSFLNESKLLIACSGGIDSMVLAHLATMCDFNFSVAHCNYKLRGKASDLDEALVTAWCKKNDKQIFLKTFDLSDEAGSIQLQARNLRYDWFDQLLNDYEFEYLLTAHHADDTMETFFINLSRGTGLEGLTGIPEKRGNVVRPLLPFYKKEIIDFAKAENIAWREDESNTELKYLRNKIRHEVVPKFSEINPVFAENFQRSLEYLGLSAQLLADYGKELKTRIFKENGDEIHISIEELKSLSPLKGYLYLLFSVYGFTQWEDMLDLLNAQSGKEIQSKTHRIIKDREHLILTPIKISGQTEYLVDMEEGVWKGPVNLKVERVGALDETSQNVIYVDKETLNYPLKIRKWKIGDYFYPLGLKGRKKVSKYFKDEKFSTIEKEKQWLLCSNSDIIWILGKRPDERFKVTERTKEILKFTLVL